MNTLRFDQFHSRRFDAHPQYSYVDIFTRKVNVNTVQKNKNYKQILTQPFSTTIDKSNTKNVILCTNNHVISKELADYYACDIESHWLSIPKHMCELLHMDLIILLNTYCDITSKNQHWEVHYFVNQHVPEIVFRSRLLLSDRTSGTEDDDTDLSHLP